MSVHHLPGPTEAEVTLPSDHWMQKIPIPAVVMGFIFIAGAFFLQIKNLPNFYVSFHIAFLFFLSIALGGLFFVLVQYAARAGWSVAVRRLAENVMGTLPIFILLFVGTLGGMHTLFHHWLEIAPTDTALQAKTPYLNQPFFLGRALFYFVVWTALSVFFRRQSLEQDKSGDEKITRRLQTFSYPGIALFALTTTFAAFDWIMSTNPHFYSTIFGVLFFAGCAVSIYATLVVLSVTLHGVGSLNRLLRTEHFHDMGKFLFGHTCFWAYITFSQFFLIWFGNMPEETAWYLQRSGGWLNFSIFIAAGHFAVPFLYLMPRTIKRNPKTLIWGALWMLGLHYCDIYWLVAPAFLEAGPGFGITDVLCILGIGMVFIGTFAQLTKNKLLIALKDPRLAESLSYDSL